MAWGSSLFPRETAMPNLRRGPAAIVQGRTSTGKSKARPPRAKTGHSSADWTVASNGAMEERQACRAVGGHAARVCQPGHRQDACRQDRGRPGALRRKHESGKEAGREEREDGKEHEARDQRREKTQGDGKERRRKRAQDVCGTTTYILARGPLRAPVASPRPWCGSASNLSAPSKRLAVSSPHGRSLHAPRDPMVIVLPLNHAQETSLSLHPSTQGRFAAPRDPRGSSGRSTPRRGPPSSPRPHGQPCADWMP